MDSGHDIFLTQNSFKENDSEYDTDSAINDILSLENIDPNFELECNLFESLDDDKDLLSATQEIEKKEQSEVTNPRFSEPLSEVDLSELVKRAVPKNTLRKSSWTFHLFNTWMKERNLDEDVLKMNHERLNELLGRFVTEVKILDNNSDQIRCTKSLSQFSTFCAKMITMLVY
ncbi:hypothetical protein FSP39_011916 [Pinctada imbricata]|uniref:Uncharacterized protein n=1 Tax=Pinctada imbricata TaxID=66713 RepID=A0AA88YLH9_PINIB|nr:hypothetical protein FSP39_011916 [Pinctada imbricata]